MAGLSHVAKSAIPWSAIRYSLTQTAAIPIPVPAFTCQTW